MSVPFFGKEFTFTQPDGSQIQVRGWGDQHYAVFETLDGYTVAQNPSPDTFTSGSVQCEGRGTASRSGTCRGGRSGGTRLRRNLRPGRASSSALAGAVSALR